MKTIACDIHIGDAAAGTSLEGSRLHGKIIIDSVVKK
jgi:hypothetical protein